MKKWGYEVKWTIDNGQLTIDNGQLTITRFYYLSVVYLIVDF